VEALGSGQTAKARRKLWQDALMRDLQRLPKAHLHLHFTGSMSIPTLTHLAELAELPLPE
jgi:hypothetical protein